MYQLYNSPINHIGLFLTNLFIPFILYIICRILVPEFNSNVVEEALGNGGYNLNDFFDRNRRTTTIWAMVLILCLALNYFFIALNSEAEQVLLSYAEDRAVYHVAFIILLGYVGFKKNGAANKKIWWAQLVPALLALIMISILAYDVIFKAIYVWHSN